MLIAPASLLDAANALAVAMGWSDGPAWPAYTVPLSPTGGAPATHWGLRTGVTTTFATMIDAAKGGVLPDALIGAFTPAQVAALVEALIIDIDQHAMGHFDRIIAQADLLKLGDAESA